VCFDALYAESRRISRFCNRGMRCSIPAPAPGKQSVWILALIYGKLRDSQGVWDLVEEIVSVQFPRVPYLVDWRVSSSG